MDRADFISLQDFPHGACGDAAPLLGQYLFDEGLGIWTYVCGERPGGQSHAWIELDSVIADITADQFTGVSDPVIVTTDTRWHGQFQQRESGHPALINVYDEYTSSTLQRMYDRALRQIESDEGGRT